MYRRDGRDRRDGFRDGRGMNQMGQNHQQFGGHRVYVGDIGRINRTQLETEFSQYGPVIDVWMGSRRDMVKANFAFVVFRYPEDAEEAVKDRNGRKVCGRVVRVEHAKPVGSRLQRGGGFYDRNRGGGGRFSRRRSRSRSRDRYDQRSPSPVRNQRAVSSPDKPRHRHKESPQKRRAQSGSRSRSPQPRKVSSSHKKELSTSQSPPPRRQVKHKKAKAATPSGSDRSVSRSNSRSVSPPPKKSKHHKQLKQRDERDQSPPPGDDDQGKDEYDARHYQQKQKY